MWWHLANLLVCLVLLVSASQSPEMNANKDCMEKEAVFVFIDKPPCSAVCLWGTFVFRCRWVELKKDYAAKNLSRGWANLLRKSDERECIRVRVRVCEEICTCSQICLGCILVSLTAVSLWNQPRKRSQQFYFSLDIFSDIFFLKESEMYKNMTGFHNYFTTALFNIQILAHITLCEFKLLRAFLFLF